MRIHINHKNILVFSAIVFIVFLSTTSVSAATTITSSKINDLRGDAYPINGVYASGNLCAGASCYSEGDSVPHQVRLQALTVSTQYTLSLSAQATCGAITAFSGLNSFVGTNMTGVSVTGPSLVSGYHVYLVTFTASTTTPSLNFNALISYQAASCSGNIDVYPTAKSSEKTTLTASKIVHITPTPTPTNTPIPPTATPTPTNTPVPPTSTPTPTPTNTPIPPTATPTPTNTPEPTSSIIPTSTPTPTPTLANVEVTQTPTPTITEENEGSTPTPTHTPSPTVSVTNAPTSAPTSGPAPTSTINSTMSLRCVDNNVTGTIELKNSNKSVKDVKVRFIYKYFSREETTSDNGTRSVTFPYDGDGEYQIEPADGFPSHSQTVRKSDCSYSPTATLTPTFVRAESSTDLASFPEVLGSSDEKPEATRSASITPTNTKTLTSTPKVGDVIDALTLSCANCSTLWYIIGDLIVVVLLVILSLRARLSILTPLIAGLVMYIVYIILSPACASKYWSIFFAPEGSATCRYFPLILVAVGYLTRYVSIWVQDWMANRRK